MSKEVLENQIWELERQLNILQCKDRFNDEDYDLQRNLNRQIAVKKKELDRKSTRLNSSHIPLSRMPSSA